MIKHPHVNKELLMIKKCLKCNISLLATEEFFHKSNRHNDGLFPHCKKCVAQKAADLYLKNAEKRKKEQKEYYQINKQKCLKSIKKYTTNNQIKIKKQRAKSYQTNKELRKSKQFEHYQKNKKNILEQCKAFGKKLAFSDRYSIKLFADEFKKDKNGYLLIKCHNSKCKKWFIPSNNQAKARILAINGHIRGDHNFYCSEKCKHECIIYHASPASLIKKDEIASGIRQINKHSMYYSQSELKVWANVVREKAGNVCEICGNTNDLCAHHILPKAISPEKALDIENGVCLCKPCHYLHGHKDIGCRQVDLKKCEVMI